SDFPLTINRDGNIYYADTRPRSARIVGRTPDGKETVLAADATFKDITGIAAGPDGSLYITDASRADANVIRKITMAGKVSQFAAAEIVGTGRDRAISLPPEADASYCRGLAVDSRGIVYVAATGSRRVIKITPEGRANTILQAPGPWSPTGVAVFGGDVYVLEWQDAPASLLETRRAWIPRVRKVGRDGKVTTLATVSRETTTLASPEVKPENSKDLSLGVKIAVAGVVLLVVVTILGIRFAR
ncbi:MAG: hypothetical protein ABJA18_09490, partial [bacterium]